MITHRWIFFICRQDSDCNSMIGHTQAALRPFFVGLNALVL